MTDNIIQLRALGKTVWGITEREPKPRSDADRAHVWRRLTFKAGKDTSGRKQARDLRRLALLKRNEKQIQNLQMASAAKVKADDQQRNVTHRDAKPQERATGMTAPRRPMTLLAATSMLGLSSSLLGFPIKSK